MADAAAAPAGGDAPAGGMLGPSAAVQREAQEPRSEAGQARAAYSEAHAAGCDVRPDREDREQLKVQYYGAGAVQSDGSVGKAYRCFLSSVWIRQGQFHVRRIVYVTDGVVRARRRQQSLLLQ
eukprot:gene18223-24051_t